MASQAKQDRRRTAKEKRAELVPERVPRDEAIVSGLLDWLEREVQAGAVVVLFDAMPGEADLSGLAEHHRSAGLQLSFGLTRTPDQGFDLTVTDTTGSLPDIRQAALRVAPLALVFFGSFGSWALILIALISLVLMFADASHQTLWDKIAKTVVIDRPL